jgi:alkyl hydroperoxide reductase subunit AhpC
MITPTGTAAPAIGGDSFVRGEKRRRVELHDFRGSWLVVAFGVRAADVRELAALEEAFAADGAVVVAASADDWHDLADRYAAEATLRFPILAGLPEHRRITAIVDPGGIVRHVGLRRTARETLAALEGLIRGGAPSVLPHEPPLRHVATRSWRARAKPALA